MKLRAQRLAPWAQLTSIQNSLQAKVHLIWLYYSALLAEAEGFRQVERRDASVKYNHEQRDGGCSIEVYLDHRSVKITLDNAIEGRYDSTILKNVKTSQLLMLFRKPAARLVYRQPNPFYVHHNFHHSESRRFFRSVYAPIDGTLESISLGYHPSTYFILYKDGSFAHSEGIPPPLHRRLLGRQEWLPRPELVSGGLPMMPRPMRAMQMRLLSDRPNGEGRVIKGKETGKAKAEMGKARGKEEAKPVVAKEALPKEAVSFVEVPIGHLSACRTASTKPNPIPCHPWARADWPSYAQ